MRRWSITTLVLAAAAGLATGAAAVPQAAQETLTTIDSVPTRTQLDSVFPAGQALASLATIAQDTGADTGIRLRAIHALAKYCEPCVAGDVPHEALVALVNDTRSELTGEKLLLLRAAIETLGSLKIADDFTVLQGLLDHPSRDIRAATARAMRDLCNTSAITPLRVRYTAETTEQVKLAISEALRVLGQCVQTP